MRWFERFWYSVNMSVQVKVLYGHSYERCKTLYISTDKANSLKLESLENLVQSIVGDFYDDQNLRIQYRDDEGTFVTISNESDVQDAIRSCTPLQFSGESKLKRLCLRVDDILTPIGKPFHANEKNEREHVHANKCGNSLKETIKDPRKRLRFSQDNESQAMSLERDDMTFNERCTDEEASKQDIVETPFQRYAKKTKLDIEKKKKKLYDLEMKEQETQRKLLLVKSNPSDGNLCRSCHLRLGHTARNCEYGKCESVFVCGEEKLHPGEIDSRSIRLSIKNARADIAKLERELSDKENASKQLSQTLTNKIEAGLMKENADHYTNAGQRKWLLLRKHVFIIEKYCKSHYGGRIPPKHKLSDILSVALQKENSDDDSDEEIHIRHAKQSRPRGNPAKGFLESEGITFPDPKESSRIVKNQKKSSLYRCAPSNRDEEAEQLNMVLQQSLMESDRNRAPSATNTSSAKQNNSLPIQSQFQVVPPFAPFIHPMNAEYHAHQATRLPNAYFHPGIPVLHSTCDQSDALSSCTMGPPNLNQEVETSAVLDSALNLSHHFSVPLHEEFEDKMIDNSPEHDAAEQLMQLSQIPLNEQK